MRRADRQVTDLAEIEKIVQNCDVCRLGLCSNGMPYVVPMNFGYRLDGESLTLYFHCAGEGKKLDIIRQNANAFFEMDCGHQLVQGKLGCDWSMNYESVMGSGAIVFLEDPQEKTEALACMMEHYAGRADFEFPPAMLRAVTVLKLSADAFTAKKRK